MEKQLRDEKTQGHSIVNTVKVLPNNNNNNKALSLHSLHSVGMFPDPSDLSGGCLSTGLCL